MNWLITLLTVAAGLVKRLFVRERGRVPQGYRPIFSSASIVGLSHHDHGELGQDLAGTLSATNGAAWAAYVVDGAGGEGNGLAAAAAVEVATRAVLSAQLDRLRSEEDLKHGLDGLFHLANHAAQRVGGGTTLVVFVFLANGQWGALQVGDAIFAWRDLRRRWTLPMRPRKKSRRRNETMLLGYSDSEYKIFTASVPLTGLLLGSDWLCGRSRRSSPIRDWAPEEAPEGDYWPNFKPLNALLQLFVPDGRPLSDVAAIQMLKRIQAGEIAAVSESRDDMSLVAGLMEPVF